MNDPTSVFTGREIRLIDIGEIVKTNTTRKGGEFVTTAIVNEGALLLLNEGNFRWKTSDQFEFGTHFPLSSDYDYLLGVAARDFKKGEFIDYKVNENTADVLTNGEEIDPDMVIWSWHVNEILEGY